MNYEGMLFFDCDFCVLQISMIYGAKDAKYAVQWLNMIIDLPKYKILGEPQSLYPKN